MGEARVTISLGSFQHGVKIPEPFFDQLRTPLHHCADQMCSGIDLTASESEIDLGTGITHNEFRFLEADQKRKNPAGYIDLVSDRLRTDSNA